MIRTQPSFTRWSVLCAEDGSKIEGLKLIAEEPIGYFEKLLGKENSGCSCPLVLRECTSFHLSNQQQDDLIMPVTCFGNEKCVMVCE